MPNNTFYFLRHAETEKDPNIQSKKWSLSLIGERHARQIAESGCFDAVDVVISSCEKKAFDTAEPIAGRLGSEIIQMDEFNEVARGDKFLSKEEFEALKREKLENLDCKKDGGESGREAIARFNAGIQTVDNKYSCKNILIVSHGTILSLYFANVAGDNSDIYKRWKSMGFCSWGKVKRGLIEKNITN